MKTRTFGALIQFVIAGSALIGSPRHSGASYILSTLYTFTGSNGSSPIGNLVMDTSGNIYGTTESGGAYGDGTVFEITGATHTYIPLVTFDGSNGARPNGGLTIDASGDLFGTTGGSGNQGETVFELMAGSHVFQTLVTIPVQVSGAAAPIGPVYVDSGGNIFGAIAQGAGRVGGVFELLNGAGTITPLASFDTTDGSDPAGRVVGDSAGDIYGIARHGGTNLQGTVYEVAAGSGTITPLAGFGTAAIPGETPSGGLTMDANGNMYGVTKGNGGSDWGSIYEITAGSHAASTLVKFPTGSKVSNFPYGEVLVDGKGNLYGTTSEGGILNSGTVYEVPAGQGTLETLVDFNGIDGDNPEAGVAMDSAGDLFGTTEGNGITNDGTVFELGVVPEPDCAWLVIGAVFGKLVGRRREAKI